MSGRSRSLTKKFDFLCTPDEYLELRKLSAHFSMSMGEIIRLSLRDLRKKAYGNNTTPVTNIIDPPKTETLSPEFDPFWKNFRNT